MSFSFLVLLHRTKEKGNERERYLSPCVIVECLMYFIWGSNSNSFRIGSDEDIPITEF